MEEQVKAHIESKLASGNSDSEQQSVNNSTLSNESDPNVPCDIHINVNDVGPRESNKTFLKSNGEKYMTNNDVIDRDKKRGEDHSHKECSTYVNSPNATLLERPLTFDKRQTTKAKDSSNYRGSVNIAYTNYSTYDP